MEVTLIVDDPELASVLSGTHLPNSEGWKAELAWQRQEVGRSVGMEVGFSTGNQTQVTCMVAQWFTHYATDANFLIANISEPKLITLSSVCLSNNLI